MRHSLTTKSQTKNVLLALEMNTVLEVMLQVRLQFVVIMKHVFFNNILLLKRFEISITFILLLNLFVKAQSNYAKNWQFGANIGLVFNGGVPSYTAGTALTNSLGCSAISDLTGSLLFYTDGVTIYNSANSVMSNGTGLDGVNASQPAIILKQPGNRSIYYVFTVGGYSTNIGLKYSIVDMSLAAGMGSVTAKNIIIDNNCRDKLTAGKHCNGNDLWVVSTYSSNTFSYCSVALTPTGVGAPITGSITNASGVVDLGQIKLSPNSRKFALSCFRSITNPGMGIILRMVADFDNTSGQITIANYLYPLYWSYGHNALQMADAYGIEFSPNSQYVYTNSAIQQIVKLGLCDSSESSVLLQESSNQVDTYGNKRQYQLAPNGNIYVARNGTTTIGRINNPGSATATSYTSSTVFTGSNICQWGLPNFPAYYFEEKPNLSFTYTNNVTCLTASFSTHPPCSRSGYVVTGYQWNFGDPLSGSSNISFIQNPSHVFTASGNYSVSLIRYFLCNTSDTISQLVNITQPILSTSTATNCFGATATVQAIGGAGPYTYLWSSNSQTNSTANFTTSGIYSVTVTDQGAGNCVRIATIAINVPTITITPVINPSVVCFGSNNAQVSVNVTGGSGIYMYNYAQTTQSTGVFNNLYAGTHTVTVSDFGFNCVLTKTFSILSASPITLLAASNPSQICEGSTLSIIANAGGGSGAFSYSWQPSAAQNNSLLLTPPAGNYVYTATATDTMVCTATQTIAFVVHPSPTISVSSPTVCKGTQVNLVASGAPVYTWQPGNVNSSSLTLNATNTINYTVSGANNFGCISTKTIAINVLTPVTVTANCNSPICVGDTAYFSAGAINLYQWQGPNNFITTQQNPQLINVQQTSAGTYTLVTTDVSGCTYTVFVGLLVNGLPQLSLIASSTTICAGQKINLAASGADTYTWMNGANSNTISTAPLNSMTVQASGTDTLTNCSSTSTLSITVKECNLSGIKDGDSPDNLFLLYPNPNKGEFVIKASIEGIFIITNALGEKIKTDKLQVGNNQIKLDNLANSIYLITILFDNRSYSIKIVVH